MSTNYDQALARVTDRGEMDTVLVLDALGFSPRVGNEAVVIPTIRVTQVLADHRPRWEEEMKRLTFSRTTYFTNGQASALTTLQQLGSQREIIPLSEYVVVIADPARMLFHQAAENLLGEGATRDPDPFGQKMQKVFDVTYDEYPYVRGFCTMLTRFTATALGVPYQPDKVRGFARLLVVPSKTISTTPPQREGSVWSLFRGKER